MKQSPTPVLLSLLSEGYEFARAPAGGVWVRGRFYQGGKFIPNTEIQKALEERKMAPQEKEEHARKLAAQKAPEGRARKAEESRQRQKVGQLAEKDLQRISRAGLKASRYTTEGGQVRKEHRLLRPHSNEFRKAALARLDRIKRQAAERAGKLRQRASAPGISEAERQRLQEQARALESQRPFGRPRGLLGRLGGSLAEMRARLRRGQERSSEREQRAVRRGQRLGEAKKRLAGLDPKALRQRTKKQRARRRARLAKLARAGLIKRLLGKTAIATSDVLGAGSRALRHALRKVPAPVRNRVMELNEIRKRASSLLGPTIWSRSTRLADRAAKAAGMSASGRQKLIGWIGWVDAGINSATTLPFKALGAAGIAASHALGPVGPLAALVSREAGNTAAWVPWLTLTTAAGFGILAGGQRALKLAAWAGKKAGAVAGGLWRAKAVKGQTGGMSLGPEDLSFTPTEQHAQTLARRIQKYGEGADAWMALFAACYDRLQDFDLAVQAADRGMAQGDWPDLSGDVTAEEAEAAVAPPIVDIAGWAEEDQGKGVQLGWDQGPAVGRTKGGKRIYTWVGTGPDKGKRRRQASPPGSRSKGKQDSGAQPTPAPKKAAEGAALSPEEMGAPHEPIGWDKESGQMVYSPDPRAANVRRLSKQQQARMYFGPTLAETGYATDGRVLFEVPADKRATFPEGKAGGRYGSRALRQEQIDNVLNATIKQPVEVRVIGGLPRGAPAKPGEFSPNLGGPRYLLSTGKGNIQVNAQLLEEVRRYWPDAKMITDARKLDGPVWFESGGKRVGVLMPIAGEDERAGANARIARPGGPKVPAKKEKTLKDLAREDMQRAVEKGLVSPEEARRKLAQSEARTAAQPITDPGAHMAKIASMAKTLPRQKVQTVQDAVGWLGGKDNNLVDLADLKKALLDLSRDEMHAAVYRLIDQGVLTGSGHEGRQQVSPEQRAAEIPSATGAGIGLVKFHPYGPGTAPSPPPPKPQKVQDDLRRLARERQEHRQQVERETKTTEQARALMRKHGVSSAEEAMDAEARQRQQATSKRQQAKFPHKKAYTTGDVGRILKVAPRTVSKWFDTGKLKGYRIPGSQDRRVPHEVLVKFMKDYGLPTEELEGGA